MYAIVEIHDVSPFYKQEVYQAVEFLQRLKIDKFSLLVILNYMEEYPLNKHKDFVGFLKALGQEIVLHGYSHEAKVKLYQILYASEEKYKIKSLRTRPYISFTAGSDDHGGMDVGRTWIEAQALSKEEFLQALREGRTSVDTEKLGYERLLNMISRVGYDFLLNKGKIPSALKPFTGFIFMHSNNPITELFLRTFLGTNAERHSFLKEASDKVPKLALERLLKEPYTSTLGELILALILHSAPTFLAYGQKAEEKRQKRLPKASASYQREKRGLHT